MCARARVASNPTRARNDRKPFTGPSRDGLSPWVRNARTARPEAAQRMRRRSEASRSASTLGIKPRSRVAKAATTEARSADLCRTGAPRGESGGVSRPRSVHTSKAVFVRSQKSARARARSMCDAIAKAGFTLKPRNCLGTVRASCDPLHRLVSKKRPAGVFVVFPSPRSTCSSARPSEDCSHHSRVVAANGGSEAALSSPGSQRRHGSAGKTALLHRTTAGSG